MKKIVILLIWFVTLSNYSQKINITGTVIEAGTNQKLEYATIVLKPVIEKAEVTGGMTNHKGKFDVSIKKGTYLVSVEYISFDTKVIGEKVFTKNTNLGAIFLKESEESLDEVEIIAEKSTVEVRLDKKIYNVGKDMTVKGGTAIDVLDNLPSVTVDVEGAVSLRGNDNVRILIDGIPSNFSATEILKQLSADAIKKVEVITSPSARYDAEGTAGIINIVLRKGKAQGLNSTLSLTTINPKGNSVSAKTNLRVKKMNIFNRISYSERNTPGNFFYENEYFQVATNPFSKEERSYNRFRKFFNTSLGVRYSISDKTSMTNSITYVQAKKENDTENKLTLSDANHVDTGFSTRNELLDNKSKGFEYLFNFVHKFNKNGHKIMVKYKYEFSDVDEFTKIIGEEFTPNPEIALNEKTIQIEENNGVLYKVDYVLPIGENQEFEAGFKHVSENFETDYVLKEEQVNGEYLVNVNVSNLFTYKESTTAFYTQYGNKLDKLSMLFGLRAEISDINIISQGITKSKNYTKWFPTVNMSYEVSDTEDLTLAYNRRIRRPRSYFVNPFVSRSSATNIFQGNPNLNPAYSNGLDISYMKKWNKLTGNTSLYYTHSTDVFQFTREYTGNFTADGVPIILTTPKNIAKENRFGWEFSLDYKAFKWWRLYTSFNLFKMERYGDDLASFKNDSWNTRLTSRVKLPLKIDWQTTISYRGPNELFQSEIKGMTSVNMALSKDVFKDKATISLSVSDLFNSRKRKSTTILEDFSNVYSEMQWRSRQIRFNFTYRFNKKKRRERNPKKSIRYRDDG